MYFRQARLHLASRCAVCCDLQEKRKQDAGMLQMHSFEACFKPDVLTRCHAVLFACCDLQEKRKRDAGMQSRGKSTVEEEKRIARQFGVYSGFD
jgi:hypothetical protein